MKFVDQAQALRKLVMEASGARARTVAVTSGKGGVGKTNVAVNLAIRLTQMGRRVVLLDADLGTANADVLCDLRPTSTLAHVVSGRRSLPEAMIEAPGGFRLIPGASGLAHMAALSEFERAAILQQLEPLEREADLILIDTGAGVGPNVLSFAAAADEVLVVTTPEPTAITDAYAVIKSLVRPGGPAAGEEPDVRLLVNGVADAAEGLEVFNRVNAVCRKFLKLEVHFAGYVSEDAHVSQAVRRRRPFVLDSPACEASLCIQRLAHKMDRHAIEPRGLGLFQRMRCWLAG
jgi:flagellar biosynthesis protein FlhG